jgi:hypothetical protein
MNVEQDIEMSTDEALISALTPKQVGEIELQPFSLMRQVISTRLCRSDDTFFNSVVTAWVCTLSDTEVLERTENATQARLAAFEWAEAQGYSITHYKPLMDAYKRLNAELAASTRARMRGSDGDAPKNDGGQLR